MLDKGDTTMTGKTRNQVYDIVTEKVIAALESGNAPWSRPWTVEGLSPANLVSKRAYRGVNVFLLAVRGMELGVEVTPWWLTYNQAKEMGGNVRKGEKGTMVVFWKRTEYKVEADDSDTVDDVNEDGTVTRQSFLLRYYTVFNLCQCEGIPAGKVPAKPKGKKIPPVKRAESIVKHFPAPAPSITHAEQPRAFFRPSTDSIVMPKRSQFNSVEGYYGTLFHEMTHATGMEKRLNRPGFDKGLAAAFGSPEYAKEELVAEMGAALLCGVAGIDPNVDNSAAYLRGWIKALENDKRLVVVAAQQAQKAADWVLGVKVK